MRAIRHGFAVGALMLGFVGFVGDAKADTWGELETLHDQWVFDHNVRCDIDSAKARRDFSSIGNSKAACLLHFALKEPVGPQVSGLNIPQPPTQASSCIGIDSENMPAVVAGCKSSRIAGNDTTVTPSLKTYLSDLGRLKGAALERFDELLVTKADELARIDGCADFVPKKSGTPSPANTACERVIIKAAAQKDQRLFQLVKACTQTETLFDCLTLPATLTLLQDGDDLINRLAEAAPSEAPEDGEQCAEGDDCETGWGGLWFLGLIAALIGAILLLFTAKGKQILARSPIAGLLSSGDETGETSGRRRMNQGASTGSQVNHALSENGNNLGADSEHEREEPDPMYNYDSDAFDRRPLREDDLSSAGQLAAGTADFQALRNDIEKIKEDNEGLQEIKALGHEVPDIRNSVMVLTGSAQRFEDQLAKLEELVKKQAARIEALEAQNAEPNPTPAPQNPETFDSAASEPQATTQNVEAVAQNVPTKPAASTPSETSIKEHWENFQQGSPAQYDAISGQLAALPKDKHVIERLLMAANLASMNEGVGFERSMPWFEKLIELSGIQEAKLIVPLANVGASSADVDAVNKQGKTGAVRRTLAPGLRVGGELMVKPVVEWSK